MLCGIKFGIAAFVDMPFPDYIWEWNTVWKFHDFYITQILREIKFWDSRSAKSAILTHLEALNSDFYAFLHFLKPEIYQINKIQCL